MTTPGMKNKSSSSSTDLETQHRPIPVPSQPFTGEEPQTGISRLWPSEAGAKSGDSIGKAKRLARGPRLEFQMWECRTGLGENFLGGIEGLLWGRGWKHLTEMEKGLSE